MKKALLLCIFLFSFSAFGQTYYLNEDFSAGSLPAGWVATNSQTPCVGWEFGDSLQSSGFNIIPNGNYAAVNDDKYDNATGTANYCHYSNLTSPMVDVTGADSLRLEFDYYAETDLNGNSSVKLAADGVNFNYSFGITESNSWSHFTWNIPLSQYSTTFRIRFSYDDGNTKANGLAIKNVRLFDPASLDLEIFQVFHSNILPAQNAQSGCRVRNLGLNTINSFKLEVFIDGALALTQNYSGLDLLYQQYLECLLPTSLPAMSPGMHSFRYLVSNVNGQSADEDPSNDESSFSAKAVSVLPERHPLVIDKTGAWCTYCADGSLRLDSALYNYPVAIGVAMHNGDMMDSTSSASWTGYRFFSAVIPGGYPQLSVDGYKFAGDNNVGFVPQDYSPHVLERLCMYEPVGVTIKDVQWSQSTQTVTATVEATVYDTVIGDLRPNLLVLADEVYGLGTGWDQVNSANTWVGHPYYGLGNPIVGFHHHHVLLSMRGGAWGTEALIPDTAYPGSVYQQTYSMHVSEILPGASAQTNIVDVNNISLIGLVQNYNAGDVNDRRILNAKSGQLLTLLNSVNTLNPQGGLMIYPSPATTNLNFDSDKERILSIEIYDLRGILMLEKNVNDSHVNVSTAGLASGIYIAKAKLENGSTLILRCVIAEQQ